MKEYILLYKSKLNDYCNLDKHPQSKLLDLNIFYSEDYSRSNEYVFIRELILNNITYVYNDFKNRMMYIGFGEWFIDGDIDGPAWEDYGTYVNEKNSCKITVDNFIEFTKNWLCIKEELPPFAIIYRDELDWIHCKGFATQSDMELFVKNYKAEVAH